MLTRSMRRLKAVRVRRKDERMQETACWAAGTRGRALRTDKDRLFISGPALTNAVDVPKALLKSL